MKIIHISVLGLCLVHVNLQELCSEQQWNNGLYCGRSSLIIHSCCYCNYHAVQLCNCLLWQYYSVSDFVFVFILSTRGFVNSVIWFLHLKLLPWYFMVQCCKLNRVWMNPWSSVKLRDFDNRFSQFCDASRLLPWSTPLVSLKVVCLTLSSYTEIVVV